MNPFFDISEQDELPKDALALRNLGDKQAWLTTIGRKGSDFWGTPGTPSKTTYRNTTDEDYDQQFVRKLCRWKPVYRIDLVLEHHYNYYQKNHDQGHYNFLNHMRYVILPVLKKKQNAEICAQLFEKWLNSKEPVNNENQNTYTVTNNNTINVGSVNAPTQFQQNSDHSTQTQHNHFQKEDVKQAFELLQKDIQHVNELVRKDFAMEMDYAITQLERGKDIKPQLLNIGGLIKDVGMGTFTNLLAAPVFELIKPYLGIS